LVSISGSGFCGLVERIENIYGTYNSISLGAEARLQAEETGERVEQAIHKSDQVRTSPQTYLISA